MMAVFSNKEPFDIYAEKSITAPEQLIGKKVATSGPASESQTAFTLYLKKAAREYGGVPGQKRPGLIDRFSTITAPDLSTSRIGIP